MTILPRNRESFDWTLAKDGTLKELEQEFRIAPNWDGLRVEADLECKLFMPGWRVLEPPASP